MKNNLVNFVTRRNIQRNSALFASTLCLLAAIATPGFSARLNPQPLPPRWGAVAQAPTFDAGRAITGLVNFLKSIIIIGGRR